ncbi:MAG: hypothetical protein A4E48_00283 [Methanosaeta sp. PtaU1.Bin060]|nr:MAG: hypothetical protein A4E48_00283 [Methanosaeta sp. PtaU1.Bin060]
MPFINAGQKVFTKYPSDIQIEIDAPAGKYYIPISAFSWDWTIESQAEHWSGQRHATDIVQGNIDVKGTFETGWVTPNKEDAATWEYLVYTYLLKLSDMGTPVEFKINCHEREYTGATDESGNAVVTGGAIYQSFTGCRITKLAGSVSQGSVNKRTFEWQGKRTVWGVGGEEEGGI